jgi:hypothetical protein
MLVPSLIGLGKLTKPFTMISGGYVIIRDATSERSICGA